MLSSDAQGNINASDGIAGDNSMKSLLVSIAFEELELANAIYEEAEKIKSALNVLRSQDEKNAAFSVKKLVEVNRTAERKIKDIIKEEMLLYSKFENALGIHTKNCKSKRC